MSPKKIILPKTAADLLNPERMADLRRGFALLNAFQNLRLSLTSNGQVSDSVIQIGGNASLLSGVVVIASAGGVPVITTQPVGGTYSLPHTMTVVATGAPAITYQWQFYNVLPGTWDNVVDSPGNFSGATTAALTIENQGPAPVQFRVIVSNALGAVTSDEVTITIV